MGLPQSKNCWVMGLPQNEWLALSLVPNTENWWLIVNITHSFSHQDFDHLKRTNYADAKEWCENGAKNGFKAGRLFEPKTQSFNDKVHAESKRLGLGKNINDWIGIKYKFEWGDRRSDHYVYNSNGHEPFENWGPHQPSNDAKDRFIQMNTLLTLIVSMTLEWLFWQILISYCKFLMSKLLKWGITEACTIILSKDIHKYSGK